ncbi:MAG: hypothetical protein ABIO88_01225, partial [Burkholderiaceae bacterium]
REGGNPWWRLWIPAFAGMTALMDNLLENFQLRLKKHCSRCICSLVCYYFYQHQHSPINQVTAI